MTLKLLHHMDEIHIPADIFWFLNTPEGKFLVTKFEFGGSFGMSLEGDCHEVEVRPNL
jgi:hypothetical protein